MYDLDIRDDGAAEFLGELDGLVPQAGSFALAFGNAVDYAVFLQDRHGYFVIDDAHLLETVTAFLARLVESEGALTDEAVERALMDAAEEEVAYLTDFIGRMRPPLGGAASGEPHRPARQGGWADRTTDLVNGFYARVGGGPVRRFPVPSVAYQGKDSAGRRLTPGGHNQPT